jgi:3'(2'), 5'-bisphosphate nucleotidase
MTPEPKRLVEPLLALAAAAGREIIAVYESAFTVERKDDDSPVTAADRVAHDLIARELGRLTPGVPVWSEEAASIDYPRRAGWDWFWLVDPLDGTREFVKRNGEFTVNIALVSGHAPVLGIVHVPVTGRDYFGWQGGGAFRRDRAAPARAIRVRRPAPDPPRVVGSRSHGGGSLAAFLGRLGPHEIVPMGSSLKFCLVAEGEADVYPRLGPTCEWDTAAAQAIVEAAGGGVLDLERRPLRYNTGPGVLNPHFVVFGDEDRDWVAYARP